MLSTWKDENATSASTQKYVFDDNHQVLWKTKSMHLLFDKPLKLLSSLDEGIAYSKGDKKEKCYLHNSQDLPLRIQIS